MSMHRSLTADVSSHTGTTRGLARRGWRTVTCRGPTTACGRVPAGFGRDWAHERRARGAEPWLGAGGLEESAV